jgi:tRNA pseudouridine38-40 synthase
MRVTLAYVGTHYSGWQIQQREITVQAMLERAIERVAGSFVRVQGAGRTDAGVHALGQVAHFDIPTHRLHIPWRKALNALLPGDIAVVEAAQAEPGFHARYAATAKTYAYHLWTEAEWVYPQRRPFVWKCGPMDLKRMDEAADLMVGEHDFRAFQNVGTPVGSTVRTITDFARWQGSSPAEVVYRVRADGFLKQMVRNLMGCLYAVGRGRIDLDEVRRLLAGCERCEAPATAPAQGLTLETIEY